MSSPPHSIDQFDVNSVHSNGTQSAPKTVPAEVEKPRVVQIGDKKVSWDAALASLKKEPSAPAIMKNNLNLNAVDVMASQQQEAQDHIIRAAEKWAANKDKKTTAEDQETDSLFKDIAAEESSRASEMEANDTPESNASGSEANKGAADEATSHASAGRSNRSPMAKGRFRSLVKQHMATNDAEQALFNLSKALTHMNEDEHKETKQGSARPMLARTGTQRFGSNYGKAGDQDDIESQSNEFTETHPESEGSFNEENGHGNTGSGKRGRHKKGLLQDSALDGVGDSLKAVNQFLDPRKDRVKAYARKVIVYVMLPSIAIAAILFYLVENPGLCPAKLPGNQTAEVELDLTPRIEPVFDVNGTIVGNVTVTPEAPKPQLIVCPGLGASVSWWFLFLGVRQVVTFTMALITQSFIVDFLALGTRVILSWLGPVVTLFLVNAKGWPFILTFWAVYDLILLAHDQPYAHHWGYWQDWVSLFNEKNPSGNVVDNEWNMMVLRISIFVGVAVAFKRLFVSLFLGRQTFARYGEQLSNIMKDMVLLGEVATLAKDIERFSGDYANNTDSMRSSSKAEGGSMQDMLISQAGNNDDSANKAPEVNAAEAANAFMAKRNGSSKKADDDVAVPGSQGTTTSAADEEFSGSQRLQLEELLDAWEEPQTAEQKEEKKITIGAVLQFRQALAFMKVRYPFLPAFGLADTREHCIESAQKVYDRLLLRTPSQPTLPFDTLALLAKDEHEHKLDQAKAKLLIQRFRPDRDGKLTKLDFVKSVDSVYRAIRLLSANITNSSQIDKAVETIFNMIFYLLLAAVALAWFGVDPLQLFLSFSSVLLAFAFMFGNSSSKYFEGILFILAQAPYGVGDRIHLSRPDAENSIDGSAGWVVERITLYTTSLYYVATNERATIANGSVASMRVINAARSPNAQIFVNMKFSIDTPYEKVEIYKAAIEQFLKDRPREWLAFVGFRPTEVAVEKGYINYLTIAQHRSCWQDWGPILMSKAELVTYEMEVAKQLEMTYHMPHMPVDLNMNLNGNQEGEVTPQNIMGAMSGAAPKAQGHNRTVSDFNPRDYINKMGGRNRGYDGVDGSDGG